MEGLDKERQGGVRGWRGGRQGGGREGERRAVRRSGVVREGVSLIGLDMHHATLNTAIG